MIFKRFAGIFLAVAAFGLMTTAQAEEKDSAELLGVEMIWDAGDHNAFTDLIRFEDNWYCTFREGDDHVGGDGRIRVIRSADAESWESVALIGEEGIDLRDPKLSIAPNGRLMVVCGGSVYEGRTLVGRQPRVMFSANGETWTDPVRILDEGDWLWRVTWHEGTGYGVSYHDATEEGWTLSLFKTSDGLSYERITYLEVPERGNEVTLRFRPDGSCIALVRREAGSKNGYIGVSDAPYTNWNWVESSMRFGGQDFIILPSGAIWGGTREYSDPVSTALAKVSETDVVPVLKVPSGGDTSYPGFVWHDETLWMSYYASHEGKSKIYLARFRIEE